jgi:hypothetical protein
MALRKILAAATVAVVPVASLAMTSTSADASTRWMYKSSAERASVEWTEYGELNGVEGNVHVGYLEAETSSSGGYAWGKVIDYFCEEGEVPGGGGHHGEEYYEEEPSCDVMSYRWMDGDDISFTVDRKLNTARLTGTLYVDNHGSSATPPVDMTWTGVGDLSQSTSYEKGTDGDSTYVYKNESTFRQADVTGYIGAMGFTDDADDESWGYIEKSKTFERGSSR